ncbi:MAG: recombination protein RecR [Geminicoccaceae bacterium]|nr:MAG: recombination protein RecR [Geminicoccaceae bacterium]
MAAAPIEELVRLLAKLPGLGPRSARRAALALLRRPDTLLAPLLAALEVCARNVRRCSVCGNLDTTDPCAICADPDRDPDLVLVVEQVEDLWAMERAGAFRGRYHVLGGTLSALDAVGPEELGVERLLRRVAERPRIEVVLALSATVAGQTTAHYLAERLKPTGARITRLGYGLPVGGELNYLDEGTLAAALAGRRPVG